MLNVMLDKIAAEAPSSTASMVVTAQSEIPLSFNGIYKVAVAVSVVSTEESQTSYCHVCNRTIFKTYMYTPHYQNRNFVRIPHIYTFY